MYSKGLVVCLSLVEPSSDDSDDIPDEVDALLVYPWFIPCVFSAPKSFWDAPNGIKSLSLPSDLFLSRLVTNAGVKDKGHEN